MPGRLTVPRRRQGESVRYRRELDAGFVDALTRLEVGVAKITIDTGS